MRIDARPEPPRTRRTSDLLRLAATVAATGAVLVVGSLRLGTTEGLEEDITDVVTTIPALLVRVLATFNNLIVLALPLFLVADLAVRRRWRVLASSLAAAATAYVAAELFRARAEDWLPDDLYDSLTVPVGGGARTAAAFGLFAGVVALVTVEGLEGRPRVNLVVWGSLTGLAALFLIDRRATVLALLGSVLAGHAVGLAVRYAAGTENPRAPARAVADALVRVGLDVERLVQVDDGERGRRFEARCSDGRGALVQVLDPDRRTAQLLTTVLRNLRVRAWVAGSARLSERGAVQQAAVATLLAVDRGVRTPALVAAAEVDERTTLFAEELPAGLRTLAQLPPGEVSAEQVEQAWHQLRRLHHAGIAHESLRLGAVAVDATGATWLLDLSRGEIAASRLRMRLDRAELLVATAMAVGPERAVAAARAVVGHDDVAALPPLLQPVALNRWIRQDLKDRPGLLDELRERASEGAPEVAAEPVQLERLRPRTVVSIVAVTLAAYALAGQLGDVDVDTILRGVDWWWAAAAVAGSAVTYVGSALTISPFSPVPVSAVRWLAAQLASSFVVLVAPAAVGSAGTNARLIQRAGAPPALALATVGVATAVSVVTTVALFLVVGAVSQSDPVSRVSTPSGGVLLVVLIGVGAVGLALAVPPSRRAILRRAQPVWESTAPRLLDVLREPLRLARGVAGNLLTTVAYVVALYAAVRAYGVEVGVADVTVVYLGAGLVGSVAPTPGGLGAVEAALVAGLTAVGVPASLAVPAALLYRAATFWLPTLPGWLAFQWLQRREAI